MNTHTVNTHLEQWASIYAAVPGEQLGVRCLAQGHLIRVNECEERALYIHPPPPTIPAELATFHYKSESLTIRPRLPHIGQFAFIFHVQENVALFLCIYIQKGKG